MLLLAEVSAQVDIGTGKWCISAGEVQYYVIGISMLVQQHVDQNVSKFTLDICACQTNKLTCAIDLRTKIHAQVNTYKSSAPAKVNWNAQK
jgi:hypothetical protein